MNFFNNFFQSAFKSSKDLLENQKNNILFKINNDAEIKEEENQIISNLSEKNISIVNKYYYSNKFII